LTGDSCQDIDECTLGIDSCSSPSVCVNTEGSFECEIQNQNDASIVKWGVFYFQAGTGSTGFEPSWLDTKIEELSEYFYQASYYQIHFRGVETPTKGADVISAAHGSPMPILSTCDYETAQDDIDQRLSEIYGQPTTVTDIYDKYTIVMTGCDTSSFVGWIGQALTFLSFPADYLSVLAPQHINFYNKLFQHELGHALGLRHAGRFADVDTAICDLGVAGIYSPNCQGYGTGDPYSAMGYGDCKHNEPSLLEKIKLGWTDQVVSYQGGVVDYELSPLENVPDDLDTTPDFAHIATLRTGESFQFSTKLDSDLDVTISAGASINGLHQVTVH
jgi:hypothetical protein